ncbi:type VI secretion system Vgr family protein [Acanthopleuribacter pedis]|uniref:Type VI secretion system tip protein VgrG n=1 Tax=Acanthopleuribacter pedis TaxID=442870 RepID=A0A8J7U5E9_9BACT|nr:type VI secretion system tip protein TssI/VgrG [Acanthopleuribacter pedis]MBO1319251.1 type VI secretion system tip protein VgrG [Acanthopleuribacter pedis]
MSAIKNNVADLLWKSPGSKIQILSLQGHEALSQLYVFKALIKTRDAGLSFAQMLDKEVSIVMMAGPELTSERHFSGIITKFSQARTHHGDVDASNDKWYTYHVEFRPKFWLTTKQSASKVFQEKTSKDIITEVLGDSGVAHEWKLQSDPPERIYTLQYEESDFNFISRLLEHDGINYFFDHKAKKVVFTDYPAGFPDCTPTSNAKYDEEVGMVYAMGEDEVVSDFTYEETIGTGKVVLNDYFYEAAQSDQKVTEVEGAVPNFSKLEQYEHTQNYDNVALGTVYARIRKEENITTSKAAHGRATCRSFCPGHIFTLEKHFRGECNRRWILTETRYNLEQGHFSVHFSAIAADVKVRPERVTPKPRIYGVQTAEVTGPPGAKVYLDDLGRCKLQFHWDREGSKNDRSSMWVRVSNNYAGKDYGIQWIPRIGHEVLVSFVNGDPDLPVVTGRVYNNYNTPPLGPAQKWQNIIKTIKDNHIMFDDQDGKELVDIRAEKDMNTHVLNDNTRTVDHDETIVIGNNRSIEVGKQHDEEIGTSMNIHIGKNLAETVGGQYTENVAKDYKIAVDKNMQRRVKGEDLIKIDKEASLSVGKKYTVGVGKDYFLDVAANGKMDFGKKLNVYSKKDMNFTCDKKAVLKIKDQLTIKVGSVTAVLKKNGDITVKGKKMNFKASSKIKMKGSKINQN